MSIDWFTFIAQIINFLILVVLLKWFLYGPIVKAMQDREDKIAARLEEADQKQEEADRQQLRYREKNEDLEKQQKSLLAEAKDEANKERKRLIQEARDEVEQKRDEWLDSVARQRETLVETIVDRSSGQITAATRRALQELAGTDLEQRIGEQFINHLRELSEERREQLNEELSGNRQPVVVRTAFDMPDDLRSQIRDAVHETLNINGELTFKTSSEVICGIELHAAGHMLGWSLNEFLSSLEDGVADAVPE